MPIQDDTRLLLLTAMRTPAARDDVAAALNAALVALPGTLTNAHIFVGNGSSVPTDVAVSGDATLANTGAITLGTTAVTGKALTGYVAGTQGSVTVVLTTDSILQGMQKLDGNKPSYTEDSFVATFDHSVGAKTVVVRKIGKHTTLEIPLATVADGAGTAVASGATDIPAAYRPATTLTFAVLVVDNGTTRKAGQVVIASTGVITFSVLGTGFTNAAAAGWDRCAVSFSN